MHFFRFIKKIFYFLFVPIIISVGLSYLYFKNQLPDSSSLKDAKMQIPLRVYSADGLLISEFGEKRRIPVKFENIPDTIIKAFISAEDYRFYKHPGIDIIGLLRASSELVLTGNIQSGGSTITMQVAKNFFLSNKKLFSRKFKEIFLAIKIEQELSKNEILELYLNKIFLGNRAYGIEAAANVYYGKSINELNLAQIAMLAGLPKAPSRFNPISNPIRALIRRDWILQRMLSLGFISTEECNLAINEPVTAKYHEPKIELKASYVAEAVRKELLEKYGKQIYTDGYRVFTTINSQLQNSANIAFTTGIINNEERYPYRGAIANYAENSLEEWIEILNSSNNISILEPAIVTNIDFNKNIEILTKNQNTVTLPWKQVNWAYNNLNKLAEDSNPQEVTADTLLNIGDLIWVTKVSENSYKLAQEPSVQSSLVAIDPNNGKILAMVGGFNFQDNMYNRATQAIRQAGSSFKPFLYAAALEKGMTAATLINDAPIVYENAENAEFWRPKNDNQKFMGPTRLREGLALSRNLVSIRILRQIGIPYAINYMESIGFEKNAFNKDFSMALGNTSITPLNMVNMYAVLANGGYSVKPQIINHIELYSTTAQKSDASISKVTIVDDCPKERVMDERVNYIINDILKDFFYKTIKRKTRNITRTDLRGKTGTTNDCKDAWFIGYNASLLAGVWVGKDNNQSMGTNVYGVNTALPIWLNFMEQALKDKPESKIKIPDGLTSLKISTKTGKSTNNNKDSIFEIFRNENIPYFINSEETEKNHVQEKEYSLDDIF
jgi:penicillin-binding protein 1A